MTRHLLKLVWNRKRQNLLLAFEILLSFFVLFVVTYLVVLGVIGWWQPLGYSAADRWVVRLYYPGAGMPSVTPTPESVAAREEARETLQQIEAALRAFPQVQGVAAAFSGPYEQFEWVARLGDPGRAQSFMNVADDEFAAVAGLRVVEGRWFSREDDGANEWPVVINRRLAEELFGGASAIGQPLPPMRDPTVRAMHVVGVIEEFRQQGEFMLPSNYTFLRMRGPAGEALPPVLTLRLAPGTTASFEETLVRRLQETAPAWRFEVHNLETRREDVLRATLLPVAALAIVAAFLLLMVGLGLTGVVWQNVTQRVQEFGLRRAKGATAGGVQRQVLGELALLTTMALVVGVAMLAQLPLLPILDPTEPQQPTTAPFVASIAIAVAVIYGLTLLCGWYPSRLATRIQPAEALHYE